MKLDIDPILPAMMLGITMANLAPRQSKSIFGLVERFSAPVYTAFFVVAGAHMKFGSIGSPIAITIIVYTLLRIAGKMTGSWFGAKYSHAPVVVRKYLGICLLPQAGVAIGLAILSVQLFEAQLAHTIIMVVMTGIFLMEIFGPMLVKLGVKKAGEVGLNITEEDLVQSYRVEDVMETEVAVISAGTSMGEVIQVVSDTDSSYYPVIDNDKTLIGAITLEGIRSTFTTQELHDWLVALDIMEPIESKVTPEMALADAFEKTGRLGLEHLPVVVSDEDDRFAGVLNCRAVHRSLSAEVLSRQQKADSIAAV
jgi:CBS domain-containing protein